VGVPEIGGAIRKERKFAFAEKDPAFATKRAPANATGRWGVGFAAGETGFLHIRGL
jgi:hypothetical protein